MDPDDRVIVTLSFTLARRESALLGMRVQGGVKANRARGGYHGKAPDGYRNVSGQVNGHAKKLMGRNEHWIEPDPEQAPMIRSAWELLLEDRLTLPEICEDLHAHGYRYKSGRPFVEVKKNGKRKVNYNTLAAIFRNWTYAGWITSKTSKILPKTVRGNWEPLVSTDEFERGLEILEERNQNRKPVRKHDYLLSGLVYFHDQGSKTCLRLTCSTSNPKRDGGGTSYYRLERQNIRFLCSEVDSQIPMELKRIQVNPEHIPAIKAVYTDDIARKMGHLRPDERKDLETALKSVDEEEARAVRLFAAGKITDAVWDSLWREWQDRRNQLRITLESLATQRQVHIENLDSALQIISYVVIVYNNLSRDDQHELLRQMVERVMVDSVGNVKLELRTPFAYLNDISEQLCEHSGAKKQKTAEAGGFGEAECSTQVLQCWETRTRT